MKIKNDDQFLRVDPHSKGNIKCMRVYSGYELKQFLFELSKQDNVFKDHDRGPNACNYSWQFYKVSPTDDAWQCMHLSRMVHHGQLWRYNGSKPFTVYTKPNARGKNVKTYDTIAEILAEHFE